MLRPTDDAGSVNLDPVNHASRDIGQLSATKRGERLMLMVYTGVLVLIAVGAYFY